MPDCISKGAKGSVSRRIRTRTEDMRQKGKDGNYSTNTVPTISDSMRNIRRQAVHLMLLWALHSAGLSACAAESAKHLASECFAQLNWRDDAKRMTHIKELSPIMRQSSLN